MTMPRDITGKRFGRLVAVEDAGSNGRRRLWRFQCDCGKTVIRSTDGVLRTPRASCGCYKPGFANKGRAPASKTHGLSKTRLRRVWGNMKSRCGDPRNHRYADYGGRGIRVCSAWLDFATFAAWALSQGYSDDLQLDRIDNDGGYEPDNCRFVTPAENMANMRTSIRYVVRGEEMGMAEVERRFGLSRSTFRYRIEVLGYSPDAAITARPRPGARVKTGRDCRSTTKFDEPAATAPR